MCIVVQYYAIDVSCSGQTVCKSVNFSYDISRSSVKRSQHLKSIWQSFQMHSCRLWLICARRGDGSGNMMLVCFGDLYAPNCPHCHISSVHAHNIWCSTGPLITGDNFRSRTTATGSLYSVIRAGYWPARVGTNVTMRQCPADSYTVVAVYIYLKVHTLDIAPLRSESPPHALRYGTCSQGISQFYLHIHTFIRNRNEPYLPLPWSVYRNTEPISDILKYRYRHRRRYSQYRKIPNIDN